MTKPTVTLDVDLESVINLDREPHSVILPNADPHRGPTPVMTIYVTGAGMVGTVAIVTTKGAVKIEAHE